MDQTKNIEHLINALGVERVKLHEILTYHTFSKSSGSAEAFYIATTQRELISALDNCNQLRIPYFIIGSGTKILLASEVRGLVIKNRTSALKLAGIKGKIGQDGLGVNEAFIEVDSGVSINKLNEFLRAQKLREVEGVSSIHATVGGAIYLDPMLRNGVQSIKVWDDGEVGEIKIFELKRNQVVLSVIFRFKAAS